MLQHFFGFLKYVGHYSAHRTSTTKILMNVTLIQRKLNSHANKYSLLRNYIQISEKQIYIGVLNKYTINIKVLMFAVFTLIKTKIEYI
jgi:hypothetical protein